MDNQDTALSGETNIETPNIRDENGRFLPGVSGNPAGRKLGSPNKITGNMRQAVWDSFIALGGSDWITACAKAGEIKAVMAMFGRLLPTHLEVDADTTIPVLIVKTKEDLPETPEPPAKS